MIDKIIMNVDITIDTDFENLEEKLEELAARNKLQKWNNGKTVYYESTQEAKMMGLYMKTKGGKLKINCSLHKQFYLMVFGRLDNSGQFTMYNAKWMINNLFEEIGIEQENGFITQYEIGLNIPTDRPPMEYIGLIRGIGEKPFYIDAYFKKNRQKTTDKSRTIRKYFKVYDKGFEMSDRKRQPHDNDPNILRIETVYRREKIKITEFFSKKHLNKIANLFIKDWRTVEFEREIRGAKGTRTDQTARAKQILSIGIESYMNLINEQRKKGELSERNYRTAREFARDWNEHKKHFKLITSELEKEYREKLEIIFKKMNVVET
ncbi:MAG: hypothetical protein MJZ94_05145 [Bacteroidales bacterium]|nr:hypothetical protein [Bacteroidales bacterium]